MARRESGFRIDKKGTIDLVTEVDLEVFKVPRGLAPDDLSPRRLIIAAADTLAEQIVPKLYTLFNPTKWKVRWVAAELVLSEKTVERHRANILEKLGMRDRVELTRYAIRRGLVQP